MKTYFTKIIGLILISLTFPSISFAVIGYPSAVWNSAASCNYTSMSRPSTYPVNKIILHTTEGNFASAVSWFQSCSSGASAHYVVRSSDGFIYQMVDEKDMAWHAGNLSYNQNSVGIEMEGYAADASFFTTSLTNSVKNIVVWDCNHWGIAKNRVNIIGHNQVPDGSGGWGGVSHHTDPGGFFDWNSFIQGVSGLSPTYQQLKITTATLNVRTGPGTSSPLLTTVSMDQQYVSYFQDPSTSWYLIFIPGSNSQHYDGWISNTGVSTVPCSNQVEVLDTWPITLNIRNGPSTSYSSLDKATDHQRFVTFNNSGGWYEYYTPASTASSSGWSSGAYLTVLCGCSPPVAGTITGPTGVCVGSTITLADATPSGVWSSSSTGIATVGASGIVSGISAGSATISYTVTNSCGTATTTQSIVVTTMPAAGTITGPSSVCEGSTITLTDGVTGGVWSSSSTGTATVGATGIVTGVLAGSATISYSVTNSCGTATTTKPITVNPLPLAGSITGSGSACVGATITLTDAVPGGVWSSANTAVATVGGTGIVSGVSGGSAIISYSVTNSCGTIAATMPVTISTVPAAGTITGLSTVCEAATIMLTDGAPGGVWSSSSPGVATVSGTGVVTGVSGGSTIISYTVTNSCGTATATLPTTVSALPAAGTITGSTGICVGATTTLADAVPGGVWSSGSSPVATVGGTGIVTGVAVGTATISYSVTNSCGTTVASATVTVSVMPAAGTITGSSSVCEGSTITLTDGAPGGVWSSSSPVVSSVDATGVVTGVSGGSAMISYTVSNSCGTATAALPITVNPLPATGTITGATGVCVGATTTLADAASGGVWSSGSPLIATVGGTGIVTGVAVGAATISYSLANSCGTASATKLITVSAQPVADFTASQTTGDCPFNVDFFDLSTTAGTTSWLWTIYNGSAASPIISTVQNPTGILYNVPGSYLVKLTLTDDCGTNTKLAANYITVTGGPCDDGVKELSIIEELLIKPNPTDGEFIISCNYKLKSIDIVNVVGEKIACEINKDNKNQWSVEMSNQPAGIYIVNVESDKQTTKRKIIKTN